MPNCVNSLLSINECWRQQRKALRCVLKDSLSDLGQVCQQAVDLGRDFPVAFH